MKVSTLDKEDIKKYMTTAGKKNITSLRIIGKLHMWVMNVIENPPGSDILELDINRHEELLMKLYEDDLKDEERAELNYLKKRIILIARRIADFNKIETKIQKTIKEE
jgi:hypothetical protein